LDEKSEEKGPLATTGTDKRRVLQKRPLATTRHRQEESTTIEF
jgi:hypothetical protein